MKKAENKVSVPAKKAAKTASKKAPKKLAEPIAASTAPGGDAASVGDAAPAPSRPAPAKRANPKATPATIAPSKDTVIVAQIDVGFGNALYLRGDGPGLSWSKGVPMDCDSGNRWRIAMSDVSKAFEFKVLINDSYWSAGYNLCAQPGSSIEFTPDF